MNNILINKYKPKSIDDFQLNNDIKVLLKTLIEIDNLNILLVGDVGFGKTTLINALLNEYYKNDVDNQNVLYINSLKDQGIQYYRNEVKTFSQTYSNIKKKKCIVLDDIDIINDQSQQVFRNCIDKYKNNVNFICSCTNIQKVLDSIQSRIIIIKINAITKQNIKNYMENVVEKEKIILDNDAKNLIINISNNSIRILINYLEKMKILNLEINYEIAKKLCSNISINDFESYTTLILNNNINGAVKIFYSLYDNGYSVIDILDNYFLFIKFNHIISDELIKYKIIKLLCKYITIFHNLHEDEIELALFSNNLHDILKN